MVDNKKHKSKRTQQKVFFFNVDSKGWKFATSNKTVSHFKSISYSLYNLSMDSVTIEIIVSKINKKRVNLL